MTIQLIQGEFNSNDALDLITKMIHVKIKFHENKISSISHEEDIKNREAKIKRLQKDLFDLRHEVRSNNKSFKMNATLNIE
jgi:hypothetical protein